MKLIFLIASAVLSWLVDAALPTGFVGHWHGDPDYSVLGPLPFGFNFSIAPLSNSNGNAWLMEDVFTGNVVPNSTQHFWVLSNDEGTNGTLTYCGVLLGFFSGPQRVAAEFLLTIQSPNQMQWNLTSIGGNTELSGLWTLTLSSSNNVLTSHFELPVGVVHLDASFNRVSTDPRPYLSSEGAALADLGAVPFWKCNFTKGSKVIPFEEAIAGTKEKAQSACPYGYSRTSKLMQSPAASAAPRTLHKTLLGEYEFCYIINPALNVTLAWNWNTSTQAIDVLFGANVAKTGRLSPSSQYIALGIFPSWPGMVGMDIVMGHGAGAHQGCVRNLYAEYYVGRPVENNNQTITDTMFATSGNGMHYIGFSRPWNTGHHNLNGPYTMRQLPSVSWAIGEVDSPTNCSSTFHYHGGTRGTYGVWWQDPTTVLPDYMKCPSH